MRGIIVILSLIGAGSLWAVPTDVIYSEGEAGVRRADSGRFLDAEIGDVLNTGDTVRTGKDGLMELDQKGVVLKISRGTVFTIMERERGGAKTGVVNVVLGSVKMRYDKLTGQEPRLQTASCSAGVRGTELTVFAGADGSSLFAVESGIVEVEAAGKTVELLAGEGVEVQPGRPPGEKFKVQTNLMDYSTWNDGKIAAMTADPVSAVRAIQEQMTAYVKSVESYKAYYKEYSARLAEERQKAAEMAKTQSKEEVRKYEQEVVLPLTVETSSLYLNMRFYSLAALSLRRYVAGRMYVLMKAKYIGRGDDGVYAEFMAGYGSLLDVFEQFIVPHLVAADI
jgi:hypothetical protein